MAPMRPASTSEKDVTILASCAVSRNIRRNAIFRGSSSNPRMICPICVFPSAPPRSSLSLPARAIHRATEKPIPTYPSFDDQSPLFPVYPWNCKTAGCAPSPFGRRYFACTRFPYSGEVEVETLRVRRFESRPASARPWVDRPQFRPGSRPKTIQSPSLRVDPLVAKSSGSGLSISGIDRHS